MQVTKDIVLDLLETGVQSIVKAKQNDRNTRYIAAHLYAGNVPFSVPAGTQIAFRYKKPDGTAGFYDSLPNNSPAITISDNVVTVELVEQVLTVAGCVYCEINMYNAAEEKLTTFTFALSVQESVLTDAEIISSDYYNVLTAEIAKALQAVTDATQQAENAAQSAQQAADSAAMAKDWAAGQPVVYSGSPVSIAYAGADRIASVTVYGKTPRGGTMTEPVPLPGISTVTVNNVVTTLPIKRPLHQVGDSQDVCVTRQEYEGEEKLVATYNVGFVELVGSEAYRFDTGSLVLNLNNAQASQYPICSHLPPESPFGSNSGIYINSASVTYLKFAGLTTKEECVAYITAQKEAGTPVQVAYLLAAPEVYIADPIDIDNAAGPLTVMTGGEVEVRMTELVGTRSDVSNNTVEFTQAAAGAELQTGEPLSVLFGKIKKRLSLLQTITDNALQTTAKTIAGAINETFGRTKAAAFTLYASDALSPSRNNIAFVYTQGDIKTLVAEMVSLGNFAAGRTLFTFPPDQRPSRLTCFTGFIDKVPRTFYLYPNGELKTLETAVNLNQTFVLNVTYN